MDFPIENYVTEDIAVNELKIQELRLYDAILELNKYNGWSLLDLAKTADIARSTLQNIKYAKDGYKPNRRFYQRVAAVFNISFKTLYDLKLK